ncbi:hypothetical protein SAY87_029507 [Trapa incisa]|uniref:C2H2-type domain-containing protein n=1 Tax=Trapa incisa TaxID=236973 RepID=A0AAN7K4L3_9MYRT|nr:hypothetical protein SAY87_029507 [Trapa incisa]
MAARMSLLSLRELQQLAHSQQTANHQANPDSSHGSQWVWGSNQVWAPEESDDSWEVRAFAEDYTGGVSGLTWPPRSYTCSFCKKEFRSAQALGGHMNVHRRDRASKRLHHSLRPLPTASMPPHSPPSSSSTLTLEREQANLSGGFCLLHHLLPQSEAFIPSSWTPTATRRDLLGKAGVSSSHISNNCPTTQSGHGCSENNSGAEDLDLELRLGHRPFPS